MIEAMLMGEGGPAKPGEAVFTSIKSLYEWVVPRGVKSVCVVCVGAPLGDGSTLESLGTSHFNEVVVGYDSNHRAGGGFVGDGGGKGGTGGRRMITGDIAAGGGGGGAGGYSGNGGDGGGAYSDSGGNTYNQLGGNGGGVDIYGEGASGERGTNGNASRNGRHGSGGGGGGGGGAQNTAAMQAFGGNGGQGSPYSASQAFNYGGGDRGVERTGYDGLGGAGLGWKNNIPVTPGETMIVQVGMSLYSNKRGAVRVIWGEGRAFPSTMTSDEFSETVETY